MVSIKTKFRFYRIFKSIASWINPFWIRRNEDNEIKNDHRPLILNVTTFLLVVTSSALGYLKEQFHTKQLSYWMTKEEVEQIGLGKVREQITKTIPGEPLTRFFLKLKWFLLGCVLLTIPITLLSFFKRKHENTLEELENNYVKKNISFYRMKPKMSEYAVRNVARYLERERNKLIISLPYDIEKDETPEQKQIRETYQDHAADIIDKHLQEDKENIAKYRRDAQHSKYTFNEYSKFFIFSFDKISLKQIIRVLIETGITVLINFGWQVLNQGTNNYNHQYAVIFPQINKTNEYGEHYARLLACVNASETVWSRGAFYPEFKNDIYIFAILYASIFAAITSISIKAALPIILDKLQSIIFLCCKKHDVESDGNIYLPVEGSDDEISDVDSQVSK